MEKPPLNGSGQLLYWARYMQNTDEDVFVLPPMATLRDRRILSMLFAATGRPLKIYLHEEDDYTI